MHRSLIVMVLIASIMIGQQYIVGDGAIHHQVALLERLFPLASFALSSSSLLTTKQPSLPLGALFIGVASLPTRAEARKTSPVYVPAYRNYQDYEDHGSYKFKGVSATTSTTKRLRSVTKAAAVASSGGGYTATTASLSVAQAEATTLADATTSISTTEAASLSETTTTEAASTTAAYAATTMAAETTTAEATTVLEATATTSSSASTTAVLSTSTASTEGESTSLVVSTTNDATTTQAASTTTQEASTTSQTTFTASTTGSTTQETTTRAESTTLALLADTTQAAHLTSTAASVAETTSLSSTVAVTSSASTTNVASTTAATTSAATTSASTIAASTTAAASTSAVASTSSASTNAASTSEASVAVSTSVVASTSQTATNAASTTSAASAASAETTLTLSTAVASTTTNFASFDSTVSVSAAAASASMRATSTTSAQVSVSTTAATLTSSLATATTSNFPAPPTISPAPASASAFYYNASLFSLQTRQQSSSSSSSPTANFLPLARRDLAVIVIQNPGVPLYVRPQDCTMGNCCVGTDVIPCCSSSVVTDCVNASTGVTCLDTSSTHTGEAGYAKSVFYEIGIVSACQNLIIDLQVTNGDADLYVQAGRLPDVLGERTPSSSRVPLYDWSSNNLGSDSLQFCCNARDGNTPTPYPGRTKGSIDSYQLNPRHTLASLVSFNTTGRLFVQVISWSASAHWTLRLLASTPSSPSPLLPLATHYWMLAQTHLDCSNQRSCYTAPNADISTYSCLMLAIPSLDSIDPYYAYASRSTDGVGYQIDELLPDQVAFVLTLSYTAAGQVPPPTLLENCTISAPDVLDAAGNAVFPQRLSLAAAATLTCDPLAFTEVTDTFTSFAELTTTPPFNTRSDIVQGVGAAVTSRAWTACDAFAESLLMQELNATTTTICTETRGTFEYLSDPCCNPLLLLQQCCAPRVEFVSILVPNEAAINSQCATPSCSTEAAHQLGNFRLIQSDPTVGCDSQALQSTHFFAQAKNPLSSKCARYLTWQSGSPSPYDPSLTQCVFDALQEDTFVQAAFASSVLNLSPSSFNSTDEFLVEFERLFVQRYATSSLCKVPGAPFNRRTRQIRDAALDVDAAACAAHSSCNWGFNRSPASCAGQGFRGTSFCGYCEDGWCYELSRGRGCTIRTDFYGGNLAAYCASIGGELMTQEEDGRTTWCYLPAATTQAQCFNSVTDCRYITTRSSIAQTVCAASCAIPSLNSSTCGCTPLPTDSLLAMECNYLFWDATAGRCWHDGVNNQPDCLARGGIHLGGRTWNNGYLDSPGACAAAAGACLENLNLNQSACRGACDVCPNCNESTCSQTRVCSDILTMPRIGACITPPVLSAIALEPECSSSLTTLTPLGCADVSVPKAVCLATNRTWYQPTDNITMCTAAKGCLESSNGFNLDNSYRDEASCNNCGGVSYSVFSPMNGTWTSYTWRSISWISRSYGAISTYGPAFDTSRFSDDYDAVLSALEFSALKSELLCYYSQPATLISELSCDCLSDSPTGACHTVQGSFVGVFRACEGTAVTFSTSFVVVVIPATATFQDGCTDISLFSLPATPLRTPPSIRSSLFLASLARNRYAIVRNGKDVQIGQIVGNGLRLEMQDTSAIEICLPLLDSLPSVESDYTVPDFAVCNSNLDIDSFKALIVIDASYDAENDRICGTITQPLSGYYFPIYRTEQVNRNYFSGLRSSQRGAFYAALVIYILVAVIAYARVGAVVLYTHWFERVWMLVAIWLLVATILTLRYAYFAAVIASAIKTGSVSDYILSELPTTLFFTLFSLIVLFWALLYHATVRIGDYRRLMFIGFVIVNALVYCFLIIAIAVYVNKSRHAGSSTCGETNVSSLPTKLARAYKITLSVIVLLLGIAFTIYGIQLARFMSKMNQSPETKAKFIKFLTIAFVFPLALVLQCVLLLYATFGPTVNTAASLVLLILVEIVPILVLAWAVTLPQVYKERWKDVLWMLYYLHDPDSSTMSQTKDIVSGGDSRQQGL